MLERLKILREEIQKLKNRVRDAKKKMRPGGEVAKQLATAKRRAAEERN